MGVHISNTYGIFKGGSILSHSIEWENVSKLLTGTVYIYIYIYIYIHFCVCVCMFVCVGVSLCSLIQKYVSSLVSDIYFRHKKKRSLYMELHIFTSSTTTTI